MSEPIDELSPAHIDKLAFQAKLTGLECFFFICAWKIMEIDTFFSIFLLFYTILYTFTEFFIHFI